LYVTWPVKKEKEMIIQWDEMRMFKWICDIKVADKFTYSSLI